MAGRHRTPPQSNFHVDVAVARIAAGASVDAQGIRGNTPLSKAVFNSRSRGELILLLRQQGANPHLPDEHEVTPLGLARLIANYDVAKFFQDLP
jgi:ankyrin repeat protein